jgi:hypothetical protein
MDFLSVRAIEVARLTEDQLNQLHEHEKKRGFASANSDIQKNFQLSTLKAHYGIPDHPESMSLHAARIKQVIRDAKLWRIEGDSSVFSGDLDAIHSFDWGVWNRRFNLDFSYQGPVKRGRLRKLIEGGSEMVKADALRRQFES